MLKASDDLLVAEVYDEIMRRVLAELCQEYLETGVSLKILAKLEELWRKKLKNADVISRPKPLNEITEPNTVFGNGINKSHSFLGKEGAYKNPTLKPFLISNRELSLGELEQELKKRQQRRTTESIYMRQTDGCNDISDDDDDTDDGDFTEVSKLLKNSAHTDTDCSGFIEVPNFKEKSDDKGENNDEKIENGYAKIDNLCDYIKIESELRDDIKKGNKGEINDINENVDESEDTHCCEEPLNSDDDVDYDPNWEECKNTIYCISLEINLIKPIMKYKFVFANGIMHFNGKDYIFKKLSGSAQWL